MITLRGNMFNW